MREVVVNLWSGARVVRRLGLDGDDLARAVASWSNQEVGAALRKVGVDPTTLPDVETARARLLAWPTQADLDAIATAYTAQNDGVRPTVRVLEQSTLPGSRLGAAGAVPAG